MRRLLSVALAGVLGVLAYGAEPAELPLLYQDDFEKGADRWEPTD
jgi:hypothetical protein